MPHKSKEDGLPLLSSNDIRVKKRDINVSTIKEILKIILKYRNKMPSNILENIDKYMMQNDWIASSYFNDFYSKRKHVEFEKPLSFLFPDIAKEWHPTQ